MKCNFKLRRVRANSYMRAYYLSSIIAKALNSLFSFIDRVALAFKEEVKKHYEN